MGKKKLALFPLYSQSAFLLDLGATANLREEMQVIFRGEHDPQSNEVHGYACKICTLLQTEFIMQLLYRLHLLPALLCPFFQLFLSLCLQNTFGNTLLLSQEQ